MPYHPRLHFSEFQLEVEKRFTPDFGRDDYQKSAARIAERARVKFIGRTVEEARPNWRAWMDSAEHAFDESWGKAKNFGEERLSDLRQAKAGYVHPFAFHYRLHMYIDDEDLELADELDREVAGVGQPKLFDRPVFRYEPDELHHVVMNAPMSLPPFMLREEVTKRLEKNPEDGVWLNPHNHFSLPFAGRASHLDRLNAFMEYPSKFRVCPLIGPSGSGKTRLVSEWMKKYAPNYNPNSKWEAGFVQADGNVKANDPDAWLEEWRIEKNTLIVLEYSQDSEEVFHAIVNRSKRERDKLIRVILIDNLQPNFSKNSPWRRVEGGDRATIDSFRQNYLEEDVVLGRELDNSEVFGHILAASINVNKNTLSLKHDAPELEGILEYVTRSSELEHNGLALRLPLMSALLGQIVRTTDPKNLELSRWTRRDLVSYYFASANRLPWKISEKEHGEIVDASIYASVLVVTSTLCKGIDVSLVEHLLPEQKEQILDLASHIVSSPTTEPFQPLSPNMLGHTFILSFLKEFGCRRDVMKLLAGFLLEFGKGDENDKLNKVYLSLSELVWGLQREDPRDEDVHEHWKTLLAVLDPTLFPQGSLLRLCISCLIADLMEELNEVKGTLAWHEQDDKVKYVSCTRRIVKLAQTVEQRFEFDAIEAALPTSQAGMAAEAAVCFAEFSQNDHMSWTTGFLHRFSKEAKRQIGSKQPPVYVAANHGRLKVLKHLHERGEDLNEPVRDGFTPVLIASQEGFLDVVRYLHENGASINVKATFDVTPLIIASQQGNHHLVRYLCENGADIEASLKDGTTSVLSASYGGHLEVLKCLHEHKANVSAKDRRGRTAALYSVLNGHRAVFDYLHENGADLTCVSDDRYTIPMVATINGNLETLQFLHDEGFDFDELSKNGVTCSMIASQNGDFVVLDFFEKIGVDIDKRKIGGPSMIMVASMFGQLEMVKFLQSRGSNIDLKTSDGVSAMTLACENGHLAVVEHLHKQGESISQNTNDGMNNMMYAAAKGHVHILKYLHQHDPDIKKVRNNHGYAIFCARLFRHGEVLRYLKEQGVAMNGRLQNVICFVKVLKVMFAKWLGFEQSVLEILTKPKT